MLRYLREYNARRRRRLRRQNLCIDCGTNARKLGTNFFGKKFVLCDGCLEDRRQNYHAKKAVSPVAETFLGVQG